MNKILKIIDNHILTPNVFIPLFLLATFFRSAFGALDLVIFPYIIFPFAAVVCYKQLKSKKISFPITLALIIVLNAFLSLLHIAQGSRIINYRLATLWHLLILFGIFYMPSSIKQTLNIFKTIVCGLLLLVLTALILFARGQNITIVGDEALILGLSTYSPRLYIFMHPNGSAIMCMFLACISAYLAFQQGKKIERCFYALSSVAFVLALFLTQSRTTIILFLIFSFLIALFQLPRLWHKNKKLFYALIAIFVILLCVVLPFAFSKLSYFKALKEHASTLTYRTVVWQLLLESLAKNPHPLFVGSSVSLHTFVQDAMKAYNPWNASIIGSTHNTWLEVLYTNGILALLLFALFVVKQYYQNFMLFLHSQNKLQLSPLVVALLTILACSFMESILLYNENISNYLFFFTLGFLNLLTLEENAKKIV